MTAWQDEDIVVRLRACGGEHYSDEAADEIERLRANAAGFDLTWAGLLEEIERLRQWQADACKLLEPGDWNGVEWHPDIAGPTP